MSAPDPYWNVVVGCACILGASSDDYPPEERPDYLKPYAHVKGTIASAPLDAPARIDKVYAQLKSNGWIVFSRTGWQEHTVFGVPVPGDQIIDVLIHRTDRSYTLDEAQNTLNSAINNASLNYSPTAAWFGELKQEVALPTITEVVDTTKLGIGLYLAATGLALGVGLLARSKL